MVEIAPTPIDRSPKAAVEKDLPNVPVPQDLESAHQTVSASHPKLPQPYLPDETTQPSKRISFPDTSSLRSSVPVFHNPPNPDPSIALMQFQVTSPHRSLPRSVHSQAHKLGGTETQEFGLFGIFPFKSCFGWTNLRLATVLIAALFLLWAVVSLILSAVGFSRYLLWVDGVEVGLNFFYLGCDSYGIYAAFKRETKGTFMYALVVTFRVLITFCLRAIGFTYSRLVITMFGAVLVFLIQIYLMLCVWSYVLEIRPVKDIYAFPRKLGLGPLADIFHQQHLQQQQQQPSPLQVLHHQHSSPHAPSHRSQTSSQPGTPVQQPRSSGNFDPTAAAASDLASISTPPRDVVQPYHHYTVAPHPQPFATSLTAAPGPNRAPSSVGSVSSSPHPAFHPINTASAAPQPAASRSLPGSPRVPLSRALSDRNSLGPASAGHNPALHHPLLERVLQQAVADELSGSAPPSSGDTASAPSSPSLSIPAAATSNPGPSPVPSHAPVTRHTSLKFTSPHRYSAGAGSFYSLGNPNVGPNGVVYGSSAPASASASFLANVEAFGGAGRSPAGYQGFAPLQYLQQQQQQQPGEEAMGAGPTRSNSNPGPLLVHKVSHPTLEHYQVPASYPPPKAIGPEVPKVFNG
ncbi:hypothetical protein HDU96_008292 [Phlyctochytrium bullatum]|nr:hypothetical protein HDU96_008292 [Phlyctochytrium bullatum]